MTENNFMKEWPNFFCVPAFFYHALCSYGKNIDPILIAKKLNIKAPNDDDNNDYGLEEAKEDTEIGVSFTEIKQLSSDFLETISHELNFEIILFTEIPFKMYFDVICACKNSNITIGVGYNVNRLHKKAGVLRHVSVILSADEKKIILKDIVGSEQNVFEVEWHEIEVAVGDITNGFWLIGTNINLMEVKKKLYI